MASKHITKMYINSDNEVIPNPTSVPKSRNYEHIEHQIKYKGAKVYTDKKKEIPRKDKYKEKYIDDKKSN
jgi:hypothetical protein